MIGRERVRDGQKGEWEWLIVIAYAGIRYIEGSRAGL